MLPFYLLCLKVYCECGVFSFIFVLFLLHAVRASVFIPHELCLFVSVFFYCCCCLACFSCQLCVPVALSNIQLARAFCSQSNTSHVCIVSYEIVHLRLISKTCYIRMQCTGIFGIRTMQLLSIDKNNLKFISHFLNVRQQREKRTPENKKKNHPK